MKLGAGGKILSSLEMMLRMRKAEGCHLLFKGEECYIHRFGFSIYNPGSMVGITSALVSIHAFSIIALPQ